MTYPGPSVEGEITHMLAEDAEIAEHGVIVTRHPHGVTLHGCVNSEALRDLIMERVRRAYPNLVVDSDIELARLDPPAGEEEL